MSVTALLALPARLASTPPTVETAARAALATIGGVDRVVVLGAGPEPLVHDPAGAQGRDGSDAVRITVDRVLLAAIADRGQAPRVPAERLDGDLGRSVAEVSVATGRPCVPMTVASGADPAALQAVAAGLRAAMRRTGGRTAVVAQADLDRADLDLSDLDLSDLDLSDLDLDARYPTDVGDPAAAPAGGSATASFATEAVAALGSGTPAALLALGPDRAAAVGAAGWAPMCVLALLAAAEGRMLRVTAHGVATGRTHVVAVAR